MYGFENPFPKDLKTARWKDFREILGCLERCRKDYFTLCSHLYLLLLLTKSEQERMASYEQPVFYCTTVWTLSLQQLPRINSIASATSANATPSICWTLAL